jgi:phospholipase C
MNSVLPRRRAVAGAAAVATGLAMLIAGPGAGAGMAAPADHTTTPIKHLVVIFQENVSFDHYFGTYPNATNTSGQPFSAARGTPAVNGLSGALLTNNPNGVNPRRYDPTNINDVLTCDQDHNYTDEQRAFDNGAMDKFVSTVGNGGGTSPTGTKCVAGDVMNYYDGNTVTVLWNYAQHFAMNDNSFGTTFGPSSPGAVNLVSGNTGNVDMTHAVNNPSMATPNADLTPDGNGGFSLTSDAQPYWDDCSTRDAVAMNGQNIGDKLNAAGQSWGFFEGGFRPTTSYSAALTATGNTGQPTSTFIPDEFKNAGFQNSVPHSSNQGLCDAVHPVGVGLTSPLAPGTGQYGYKDDYIPHHQPFQYYQSTANPHHLTLPTDAHDNDTPAALATIGTDTQHYVNNVPQFDTPNHQYDISDFDQLVAAIGRGELPPSALPAVSFLKAPGYQDGHPAYSDPLDEQQFLIREINALMQTPDWSSTAVVINYDDSDGWYDHAYSGVHNPSQSVADALTGPGQCGTGTPLAGEHGRCGYGPRLPMMIISPWAKVNAVDHTLTDQSSIIRFIEDNWRVQRIDGSFDAIAGPLTGMLNLTNPLGTPPNSRPLLLDPTTGAPATTTTLQVAPNPGFQGIPEFLVAQVSPFTAAGTVQFTDGTTNLGSVPVIAGQAILVTTALTAGTHTVTAVFTPTKSAAFTPSISSPVTVTVTKLF